MPWEKTDIADAYVAFLRGSSAPLLALLAPDVLDHVSGRRGVGIWRAVEEWLSHSFAAVEVDLHAAADDGDRVLVWLTLRANHVGSAFPWMKGRAPSGRPIAWPQLHVFRVAGDQIVEHWAVRDDLRVLEAIDRAAD